MRAGLNDSRATPSAASSWRRKWCSMSEITHLLDMFGHQRLREGKYTAGQIDAAWNAPVEADFNGWLKENIDKLPVAREQVEEILKGRQR